MGLLLLHYDCLSGTGQSSEANISTTRAHKDGECQNHIQESASTNNCVSPAQFVCVESLVTAMMDMYPSTFRRKNRRELFILVVAVVSFLLGLIMLTEVRFRGLHFVRFVQKKFI